MLVLLERVSEAQRLAARELRELQAQDPRNKKKRKREGGSGSGEGEGNDNDGDRDRDDRDAHESSDTAVKGIAKKKPFHKKHSK